jgi:predicted ATP-grasp superfamily ATP-dependent carboligase
MAGVPSGGQRQIWTLHYGVSFCLDKSWSANERKMTGTVLLTLGRLPKALELARALHAAGCRVLIADPFRRHVCRPSRTVAKSFVVPAPNTDARAYRCALLKIVREEKVDLVIPVSEEALHAADIAPELPSETKLFGPTPDVLRRLHDKLDFNASAAALGLPVPESARGDSEAAETLSQRMDYIVKPIHGCSGMGLSLRKRGELLQPADRQPGQIVQERLYGRHLSSFSIAEAGRILATVIYRGRIYSGTVCVCFERVEDAPQAEAWITRFVAAERYSGFVSFDFIEDAGGTPRAIECNPRLTSGVHFVDPAGLAIAVLKPETTLKSGLKPTRAFQEGHTALLEVYGALLRPREFARRLRALLTAEDVLFRLKDPMPFFMFTPMSWDVLGRAMRERISLGKAATQDIVWVPEQTASVAAQR